MINHKLHLNFFLGLISKIFVTMNEPWANQRNLYESIPHKSFGFKLRPIFPGRE